MPRGLYHPQWLACHQPRAEQEAVQLLNKYIFYNLRCIFDIQPLYIWVGLMDQVKRRMRFEVYETIATFSAPFSYRSSAHVHPLELIPQHS